MSWRTGATLFSDLWPHVQERVKSDSLRHEFTGRLLDLFLEYDVDPAELVGLHPEVDRLLAEGGRLDAGEGDE